MCPCSTLFVAVLTARSWYTYTTATTWGSELPTRIGRPPKLDHGQREELDDAIERESARLADGVCAKHKSRELRIWQRLGDRARALGADAVAPAGEDRRARETGAPAFPRPARVITRARTGARATSASTRQARRRWRARPRRRCRCPYRKKTVARVKRGARVPLRSPRATTRARTRDRAMSAWTRPARRRWRARPRRRCRFACARRPPRA